MKIITTNLSFLPIYKTIATNKFKCFFGLSNDISFNLKPYFTFNEYGFVLDWLSFCLIFEDDIYDNKINGISEKCTKKILMPCSIS